jgi:hypothetical protein
MNHALTNILPLFAAALLAFPLAAAEKKPAKDAKEGKEVERKGPFATLPQPDQAHLAKLKALGDDSWISLGSPVADAKWGCATGRSWSPKMPYAPDLHGAFLYGEANHGAFNPQTRKRGDDLWFYHAPSNKWICVWPGTDIDKPGIKINKEGIECTLDGVPCPVCPMVHGFCAVDYDTDTKQFVCMPQEEKCFPAELGPAIEAYRKSAEGSAANPSPWYYDTVHGHWMRTNSTTAGPGRPTPSNLVFYFPSKKVTWFHDFNHGRNISAIFDVAKNQWTAFGQGTFNQPVAGSDALACYDSKRRRVDLLRWNEHWVFEVDSMSWHKANSAGLMGAIGYVATFTYDSANDVDVLNLYRHDDPNIKGVWIYDPEKNAWSKTKTQPPGWSENGNGFYDPELNVHFFHNARDNAVGGMWAYRYKNAAKKK